MNLDVFVGAMGPSFGPHVYLSGTLLFVAGLAIVRAHNSWTPGWPVLITLVGWIAMLAGLGRMAAPLSPASSTSPRRCRIWPWTAFPWSACGRNTSTADR
jgi:hypothetical protein